MSNKFWVSYGAFHSDVDTQFNAKISNDSIPDNATVLRTILFSQFRASIGGLAIPAQQTPLLMGVIIRPFDVDGDAISSVLFDGGSSDYLYWGADRLEPTTEKNGIASGDTHYIGPYAQSVVDVASRRILPPKPNSILYGASTSSITPEGSGDTVTFEFSGSMIIRMLFEVPD